MHRHLPGIGIVHAGVRPLRAPAGAAAARRAIPARPERVQRVRRWASGCVRGAAVCVGWRVSGRQRRWRWACSRWAGSCAPRSAPATRSAARCSCRARSSARPLCCRTSAWSPASQHSACNLPAQRVCCCVVCALGRVRGAAGSGTSGDTRASCRWWWNVSQIAAGQSLSMCARLEPDRAHGLPSVGSVRCRAWLARGACASTWPPVLCLCSGAGAGWRAGRLEGSIHAGQWRLAHCVDGLPLDACVYRLGCC